MNKEKITKCPPGPEDENLRFDRVVFEWSPPNNPNCGGATPGKRRSYRWNKASLDKHVVKSVRLTCTNCKEILQLKPHIKTCPLCDGPLERVTVHTRRRDTHEKHKLLKGEQNDSKTTT